MASLRSVLLGGAALAAALILAGPAPAGAAAGGAAAGARTVCVPHDRRIDEASGLAAGIASPGVLYVHNDSGDRARFFALDAATCATLATVRVAGARAVDWEDLAVARDAAGVPSVYLADIGDNDAARSEVAVYRVAEPTIRPGARDAAISTARADVWRLRYPGGPVDAESLAVAPGGAGYVVTKSLLGRSTVYRLPPRPDAGHVQLLRPVGAVQFVPLPGANGGPLGAAGGLLATSAAFSPDGTLLAVRTYTSVSLWPVAGGDVAAALRRRPTVLALPAQPQGEGIAVQRGRLLLDSEGVGTPIDAVPLPAGLRAAAASASASTSASASAVRSSSTASSAASKAGSTAPSSATSSPAGRRGGNGSWVPGIVIVSLAIIGTVAWWLGQRGNGRRAGPG